MNQILTDIMGLFKRKEITTDAKDADLIPLAGKKVTSSTPVSGTTPPDKVSLITASDFVTNYVVPKVGPTTNNTVYGFEAFESNTSGTLNTALGFQVLRNNTIANSNVGVGAEALRDNISGGNNIGIGVAALQRLTTGVENTAIGFLSFLFNNDSRNTALGAYTGYNSRSNDNTYIGYRSGNESWYGVENTAVGSEAHKSVWNSNAENNVAIGRSSLIAISNGDDNTAVGYQSGINITTASSNTIVGAYADAANFSSSVILGRAATATANNQFVVGSATYNAGAVTTAAATQTKTWDVIINGVAEKILLA